MSKVFIALLFVGAVLPLGLNTMSTDVPLAAPTLQAGDEADIDRG